MQRGDCVIVVEEIMLFITFNFHILYFYI